MPPTVSIRKFRHPERIRNWLETGKTIDLIERGKIVARIVLVNQEHTAASQSSKIAKRNPQRGKS
jgi:hypothetical protein